MKTFQKLYGDSPLHLLAVIASLLIAGYGFFMIFQSPAPESTMLFFVAAIFLHDLIAFPLYSALNLMANRTAGGRASEGVRSQQVQPINYIRIPAVLSAFFLILFFPLILNLSSERFMANSGQSSDVFLGRWLGICAVLFTISAVAYAINLRRAARAGQKEREARAAGN